MKISVIGLGYVGLPLALALAEKYSNIIGFDTSDRRIEQLRNGIDITRETSANGLHNSQLKLTSSISELTGTNVYIVAVPTPIDKYNRPDLNPLISASSMIGSVLEHNAIVVYESTVYPGVTEDICGPALALASGLKQGYDFKLAYSPERINPGDKLHTLSSIVKVVSAEDEETLECVAKIYEAIVHVGVHRAPSIRVAEAAKVIENTQRDLNIALMNELALIFDRMEIRTQDVLDAARTKWNFLPFSPGLVGGHCISVDPYYLTTKAEELGYHPQVILAGRRINGGMGTFIANKLVKLLIKHNVPVRNASVGILGITFKENVPDLRNSRVPDIVYELREYGIEPLIYDSGADAAEVHREYGIVLANHSDLNNLDGVILAVAHEEFLEWREDGICGLLKQGGCLLDIKSVLSPAKVTKDFHYWSL